MEIILFLAHTEADGSLGKPALEALAAARTLAASLPEATLVVGLVGEKVQPAADTLAASGAKRFVAVAGPDFALPRYASDAAAAEAICRATQATLIVGPATSRWNRALSGVAQRLAGRADTHVTGLATANNTPVVTRWYYRQRMEGALSRTHRPWFILIEPGTCPAWQGPPSPTLVEALPLALPPASQRTRFVGLRAPATAAQTIRPEAPLLFVAGAGWTKKQADGQNHAAEAEKLILDFLQLTRASLGSSKSLVDLSVEGQVVLSFLTHLNQIGQTGATPRHPKGLATCCHGEEPHTVGWRFITERRAVNLDPNCGWARGKADVLYVADAFAVMSCVNALLARKNTANPQT
jgi:electron transfer flavoprotein alpha subunit